MDIDEWRKLLDGAPLSLKPRQKLTAKTEGPESGIPVLLLLGDGPEARALARLAPECGFVVDMAVWEDAPRMQEPELALPVCEPFEDLTQESEAEAPDEPADEAACASGPYIAGLRNYLCLAPEESPVERLGIGRTHYICIFPPDAPTATRTLEDVLASRAAYVGLWATRAGRERVWSELRARGVPDMELAAVRCPMGLGELGMEAGGPVAAAVAVLAELLAVRTGSPQRLRYED